jgi:hypothetical protein
MLKCWSVEERPRFVSCKTVYWWITKNCCSKSDITQLARTLSIVNHLPEDGHCRPKHVGGASCVYQPLLFYCRAAGTNIVKPENLKCLSESDISSTYRGAFNRKYCHILFWYLKKILKDTSQEVYLLGSNCF